LLLYSSCSMVGELASNENESISPCERSHKMARKKRMEGRTYI
jgi:hypothetical protein